MARPLIPHLAAPTAKIDRNGGLRTGTLAAAKPITAAWNRAHDVAPADIDAFEPADNVIRVGEALLGGATTLKRISEYSNITVEQVKEVLNNPLAMGWLSRQTAALMTHHACIVDAVLYQRAITGDLAAMKLFYERMKLMQNTQKIEHQYSGKVELKQVSDSDLKKLVEDGIRTLPGEFRARTIKTAQVEAPAESSPSSP